MTEFEMEEIFNKQLTIASELAKNVVEELKLYDYKSISLINIFDIKKITIKIEI